LRCVAKIDTQTPKVRKITSTNKTVTLMHMRPANVAHAPAGGRTHISDMTSSLSS